MQNNDSISVWIKMKMKIQKLPCRSDGKPIRTKKSRSIGSLFFALHQRSRVFIFLCLSVITSVCPFLFLRAHRSFRRNILCNTVAYRQHKHTHNKNMDFFYLRNCTFLRMHVLLMRYNVSDNGCF